MTREEVVNQLRTISQDIGDHADELVPTIEYRRSITVSIHIGPDQLPSVVVEQEILPIKVIMPSAREI